jgi:fused signal recognition particle receptor
MSRPGSVVLVAMRRAHVDLRQAVRKTRRISQHERDCEQNDDSAPPPHLVSGYHHPLQWSFPALPAMIQTLFGSVQQEPNLLDRLKAGIQKTREGLVDRLEDVVAGRKEIDAEVLEELEYALITADIGVNTTTEILESIRQRVDRKQVGDMQQIKQLIAQHLEEVLVAAERPLPRVSEPPAVVMVVGVNGSGKTTTIGKLASRYKSEGRSVLLCAADTFRAAAIEQLQIWGSRTSTDVIRQSAGADPSAVLFDALQAAKARKVDYVIIDTAGRLHTKSNLMAELEKMRRTAAKVIPGAPHEVLLVLDATTGQNGLEQARRFTESSGITGLVLTKLDGTAKGGIVVAIARELNLPIRYVGIGEQAADLLPFEPDKFIASLFEK